jgi:RNA polymerase sigma-70 factor
VPPDSDYRPRYDPATLLDTCENLVTSLFEESGASVWGVSRAQFQEALARGVQKRFADASPTRPRLEEYLATLYAEDLALACACQNGSEEAWEYFMREYRSYLRAATGAITKGSRSGADSEELADSLFAELFGLADGKRGERSLFRYFHGRSSLKTWLRTILAQRHIDALRARKHLESMDGDSTDGQRKLLPGELLPTPVLDPHRERYVQRFTNALGAALAALRLTDRQRLELYYARQLTLAEIGRKLGEHESSVSRNLDRCRRELRAFVEELLRRPPAMSDAELELCFQYAAEDAPIDFRNLFPEKKSVPPGAERKETP